MPGRTVVAAGGSVESVAAAVVVAAVAGIVAAWAPVSSRPRPGAAGVPAVTAAGCSSAAARSASAARAPVPCVVTEKIDHDVSKRDGIMVKMTHN